MTYASHTYASARAAELRRTGARRRRETGAARTARITLVLGYLRRGEAEREGRAQRVAVAARRA